MLIHLRTICLLLYHHSSAIQTESHGLIFIVWHFTENICSALIHDLATGPMDQPHQYHLAFAQMKSRMTHLDGFDQDEHSKRYHPL